MKVMVAKKHIELKDKAQAEGRKFAAVSLTSDMWTSIKAEAYVVVTCHYVTSEWKLSSILLNMAKFLKTQTAAYIALMMEWGITRKVIKVISTGW